MIFFITNYVWVRLKLNNFFNGYYFFSVFLHAFGFTNAGKPIARETKTTDPYSAIPSGSFRTAAPDKIPTIGVSITPIVATPTG